MYKRQVRRREEAALTLWEQTLSGLPGVNARIIPDPTDNPLDRVMVEIAPESGYTAAGLAKALSQANPPIIVRNHEVERGHFYLDPCNLHDGEAEIVAEGLKMALGANPRPSYAMMVVRKDTSSVLNWPD